MKNKKQQGIYAIPNKVKSLFNKFISWVLHIYPRVGGQFKKRQIVDYIENPFYQCGKYNDYGFHRQLYNQIMTYIVAGKFNDKTFLMTDCVGTPQNNKHKFINKLVRLKSTTKEVYSTITGYDTFQIAINLFDRKCFESNVIFDIENENQINEILDIYGLLKNNSEYTKGVDIEKDFLFSGLFFIEKGKICYYIIKKDETNKMYVRDKKYIENNTVLNDYLLLTFKITDEKYNDNNEIIEYCKTAIKKHYKQKEETKHIDLKDKFSYVIFSENEKIKKLPYDNNVEFILSEIGCDYDKIE